MFEEAREEAGGCGGVEGVLEEVEVAQEVELSNDSFFTFITHCFPPFLPISMLCYRGITCTSKSLKKTTLKLGQRGHLFIFGKVHFGQYIFSKLV